jgi:DNA mismatch repair protein MutS2
VDESALESLQFPAITARLAATTETVYGEELARSLVPSGDPEEVARRQALTAEVTALFELSAEPPLQGIADVRVAVEFAARGGSLSPLALAEVAATVAGGVNARASLDEQASVAPLLAGIAGVIEPSLRPLADEIERCVEEDGSDLRDSASPTLRKLRKELRDGRQRVTDELRKLGRTSRLQEHLQEDFVTQRGGRPVFAVKASSRRNVPGIVHDVSASGQTLFVEPLEVVELNNRQSETASAEREEVVRILRELSTSVGARSVELAALVEATGAIDVAVACAALSRSWRGVAVTVAPEVRLLAARHPLLDPAHAVPIDLDLGALRALVITGPNTGGKTVALKTLGLAALLHQSGLRIPAETAVLPVFDEVLADIGDRQSIEMSLSTFSGHISNLVAILVAASERSLVLVDEVASGTDPVEGSALAQALVARFAQQARLTIVTTHYPELKEWASSRADAANAATALDPATHEPLYRIALGRPGTSHALATAERLGLDASVVAAARAHVAPERLQIADLLAEAEAAERAASGELVAAQAERADAVLLGRETAARGRELEAEIAKVRASAVRERELAAAEAQRELAEARAELAALRDEMRVARRAQAASPAADRALGEASARARRAELALRTLDEPLPLLAPLAPGDPVEAPEVGVRGTIASIDGDEAEVVGAGGHRVRIALARLRPSRREEEPEPREPAVRILAGARSDVSDEIDVRGQRAQDAREAVRSFVDDASLAGLSSVLIVHGRGTGAVRAAVRDELKRHPLVESSASESQDGATLVQLGSST